MKQVFELRSFLAGAFAAMAVVFGPGDARGAEPAAVNDSVELNPGTDALIPVLANDIDTGDGIDAGTVEIVSGPGAGNMATPDSGGRILYEHGGGAPGSDSFTYRVANNVGAFSTPATVNVTITNNVRVENTTLTVPGTPPATTYSSVNAFTGLSFDDPICLRTPPGETNRLFVVERDGLIYIVPDVTAASPTKILFLDLPALLATRSLPDEELDIAGEGGLLSMAFHPDYATNRKFYLSYTLHLDEGSAAANVTRHHRFSEMETQAGDPNAADTSTEVSLIVQHDDRSNHNGGDMHFGPSDGYLYISTGDEGGSFDNRNNSQMMTKDFFSSMLRIDVDKKAGNFLPNDHPSIVTHNGMRVSQGGIPNYLVPADNPWAGPGTFSFNGVTYNPDDKDGSANNGVATVRTEFWAVGLRNPWRWVFHPKNGDLICADVGQAEWEEISILESGDNAGWDFFEGDSQLSSPPTGFVHKPPVHVYPAGVGSFNGESITGGVIYCGSNILALQGLYVFADYVRGNVWTIDLYAPNPATTWQRIFGDSNIACFGYDPSNGDVLYGDFNNNQVKRIVGTPVAGDPFPQTLTETGVFSNTPMLTPNPGVLCYEPNLAFWSDFAVKKRWFTVPDLLDKIDFSVDGNWSFPEGTVWVKHFDLEEERGDPATAVKVETRLLVKTADDVFGVSYQWNGAGTEADLVADEGVDIDYTIDIDPGPGVSNVVQPWRIPSRAECLACHTDVGGEALSFNTRQLNRLGGACGFSGPSTNQIEALASAGYFSTAVSGTQTMPAYVDPLDTSKSLESRFRSYLAVNCVQCHQAGGPTSANWDASPHLTLEAMGLIDGVANNDGGDPVKRLLVPGSEPKSILLHRMQASGGFDRMPNIGSNVLDDVGIQLVKDFIAASTARQFYTDFQETHFGMPPGPNSGKSDDANGDGEDNYFEFLTGQDPLAADEHWEPAMSFPGGNLRFDFEGIANLGIQVLVSPDLENWSLWDVPDNHLCFEAAGGADSIEGSFDPATFPRLYFRWLLTEP